MESLIKDTDIIFYPNQEPYIRVDWVARVTQWNLWLVICWSIADNSGTSIQIGSIRVRE